MRPLILPALVAGFFVSGCGYGPISEDWSPEAKKAGNVALAAVVGGTLDAFTRDGYLDPDSPWTQSMRLWGRIGTDLALALNAVETGASIAGSDLGAPVEPLRFETPAAPGLPGGHSDLPPPEAADGGTE